MPTENNINDQLAQAAMAGHFDEVRRLVEIGADVNYGDKSPFLGAYFNAHKEIARYLLDNGGNINHDKHSEVSLLMAAVNMEDIEFAAYLIEAGADVNLGLPRGGETALHKAAVNNKFKSMQLLINKGGEVNRRTKDGGRSEMAVFGELWGECPLHIAAVRSDRNVIELLLNAGADKTIITSQGKTPFDYAVQYERSRDITKLLQIEDE